MPLCICPLAVHLPNALLMPMSCAALTNVRCVHTSITLLLHQQLMPRPLLRSRMNQITIILHLFLHCRYQCTEAACHGTVGTAFSSPTARQIRAASCTVPPLNELPKSCQLVMLQWHCFLKRHLTRHSWQSGQSCE